ncbi:MAG: PHB depolymerase family esterase [Niabella sp.]
MRFLYILFVVIIISSCNNTPGVTNRLNDINNCDSETVIRNWEFTNLHYLEKNKEDEAVRKFKDTTIHDLGDQLKDYEDFSNYFNKLMQGDSIPLNAKENFRYPFTQTESYFSVDTLYRLPKVGFFHDVLPKYTYAATIIRSSKDQDVILIPAANNGIRLWVNGEQKLLNYVHEFINGYQYLVKAHLKKGDNFILVKLLHADGDWRFFLKSCSIKYAAENSLGRDYSSICENYMLNSEKDNLKLRIKSPATLVTLPPKLEISDVNNNTHLKQSLPVNREWEIPITSLPMGPYTVKLETDNETFKQRLFIGDYHTWFNEIIKDLEQFYTDDQTRANIEILEKRFRYVDTVDINHDNQYERKLSSLLFETSDIYAQLQNNKEAFAHVPGLHLRGQTLKEHEEDSYMIYIPEIYDKKPIPLVVMMPYESGIRPFNISSYVSNIDRIEHMKKLAEKYNFAVLWSSFRVYTTPTLIDMFCKTVFARVNDVKKDYNIDDNRIFVYGDCAGGGLALFIANKYPSYFAALGVEGPAIPDYDLYDENGSLYNSQKEKIYDFYNTVENFKSFPSYIVHSTNDEKSPFEMSKKLTDDVKKIGGKMELKELSVRKGTDLFFMNLMPENKIMSDILHFFSSKRKDIPDKIEFSTWFLKYNKSFWVTLDDITYDKKAVIKADYSRSGNSLNITTKNVDKFTIDLTLLDLSNNRDKIKLTVNRQTKYFDYPENNKLTYLLSESKQSQVFKNHDTEGPLNDFFSQPFIVVNSSRGSAKERSLYKSITDSFALNWKTNFLTEQFSIKKDVELTEVDIKNYNLIIVGNNNTNIFLNNIFNKLPVEIGEQYIKIGGKSFSGSDLSYTFIYPNPLNTTRYILVIGSTGDKFNYEIVKDLPIKGWDDFYVNNNFGEFNEGWR